MPDLVGATSHLTNAEYIRLHANAPPNKLREVVFVRILPSDDVDYLKKLVRDVGGLGYAFKFFWCDNSKSDYGRTWIQYCCHHDAHRCLKWIFDEVEKNHKLARERAERAADKKQLEEMSTLTTDLSEQMEDDGATGDTNIIRQLLHYPSKEYCGSRYVAVAAIRNSPRCLELLLSRGALDPNMIVNEQSTTAAHLAAVRDNVECLRVLGSGQCSNLDETHDAVDETSHGEGFNETKTWQADWAKVNAIGETALHVACRSGSLKSLRYFAGILLQQAAHAMNGAQDETNTVDFSIRSSNGMCCVAEAAKHNQSGVISLLSETICEVLAVEVSRPSPQDALCSPVSFLQSQSTPATIKTNRRRAQSEPLNFASKKKISTPRSHGENTTSQCLPSFVVNLNLRSSFKADDYQSPVHVAAKYGSCDAIEALFDSEHCDVSMRDSMGQTALHVATSNNQADVCQMIVLLAKNFEEDFDVVDILGRTPLYIACLNGFASIGRILLGPSRWRVLCNERRKSPSHEDVAHRPPLHAAVANNHVETVRVLLDYGVEVEQKDNEGRSALSVAAKLGYLDMCHLLIEYGASVNTRSSRNGPTPYAKARKYKHHKVADLIYDMGGR